jgi:hypothetical protein
MGSRSEQWRWGTGWQGGEHGCRLEKVGWLVFCIWGLEMGLLKPRELNHEDFTCVCKDVIHVEGGVTRPLRDCSAEVRVELRTIVWVESVPKFCVVFFDCQVVGTNKGVAEDQKLLVVL